jgi:hypothetical protein
MKTLTNFLALLALALAATTARADTLFALQPITVSGNIQAVGPLSGGSNQIAKVKSASASIPNILKALGITGQNPKKLAFYYDPSTSSIVLADKSTEKTGGNATVVATVFTFGTSTGWSTGATSTYRGGDCTTLAGNLPGTFTETSASQLKKSKSNFRDTINFITWGSISGNYFIFKGSVKGLLRPA